jgi:hypothetical protein
VNEEDVKGSKKDRLIKGILRLVEEYLPVAAHTGGIKLMWTCNSNKKPSPDKRSNSQILR